MASLYSMIGRLWRRLPDRVRNRLHRISVTAHVKKGFSRVSAYGDAVAKYGLLRGPRIWWRIQRVAAAESFPVPGSEHTVVIRPGTADADVFRSIFLRDECRVPVPAGFSPRLIVDAGAYVGYSTVYFAQTYPEARVIAIEPQPDNIRQWRVNTEGLDRVTLVQGALWHRHEPLEIDNPDAASYSFRMTARPGGDNAIRSYTIPDLMALAKTDTIDILKLDVEGAEREIFRNAGDWIHRVRIICLETHDRYEPGCTEAFLGAVRAASFRLIVEHGEKRVAEREHGTIMPNEQPAISDSFRTGRVSVIVPTYNRADLIVDALESVRAQTYRPIELIIVDDGSTDDTGAVIANYARLHEQPGSFDIRYVRQDNRGTTAARNRGLRESSGEFIQHLDSDDRLLPDKLEKQVRLLREDPSIDYVYGRAQYADESGRVLKEVGRPVGRDDSWVHVAVYHWQTGAPLYRRSVLAAIGPGDERVRCAEDLINPARIKIRGFRERFVPEAVCVWRVHSGARNVESKLSSARTSEVVSDDIASNLRAHGIRCARTENTLARYYARAGLIMAEHRDRDGARRCLKKATDIAHGGFRGLVWLGRIASGVLPAGFLCRTAHAVWWRARQKDRLHDLRPGYRGAPSDA